MNAPGPSASMAGVCAERPWLTRPVPLPATPVGMVRPREMQLFYFLAKEGFTGRGTIVDAGSYLGASAYCFGQGLRQNPRCVSARDRVHCIDLFVANDHVAADLARAAVAGEPFAVGQSTLPLFERQVAPVRDLLEVHVGNFLDLAWRRQPVEILMVDIAKTIELWKRVLELFFAELVPGVSAVVHQDYHHPWLPFVHVVMEYLADHFELAAPRVDDTTVFLLTSAIPPARLARAAAYAFSPWEQLYLMDRALARLPAADRAYVELAKAVLLGWYGKMQAMQHVLEAVGRRRTAREEDEGHWRRQFDEVQAYRSTLVARAPGCG